MLPDLPKLKAEIEELLTLYIRVKAQEHMGVIGTIPQHFVHEGSEMRIIREDGEIEYVETREAQAQFELSLKSPTEMSTAERASKLDEAAKSIAMQISTGAFESINKSLAMTNQQIAATAFDETALLMALEKMDIEFDEAGNASDLTMVISPDLEPRVREMIARRDPVHELRYFEIMNKKRQQWRDREASRKLVG